MSSVVYRLLTDKFIDVYFQTSGYVDQVLQIGLRIIGTPLGDCRRIFAQLFCQPLVCALLVG
jgi:hypothetical protein